MEKLLVKCMLTKLEEQILMTVWRFKNEGYGVNIFQFLGEIYGKELTLGVVYDVLNRLKNNSYVETFMGDSSPKRGGMKKKHYKITESGIKELVKSKEIYDSVMNKFGELAKNHGIE